MGEGKSSDDDFDEAVEFEGKCNKCHCTFLKTYVDPRYSQLVGKNRELENAHRENIALQKFAKGVLQTR